MKIAANVMVVEDEKFMADMIAEALRGQGFNVCIALNGKDALQLAGSMALDLILLDMMMPEMGGADVLKKLRSNRKTADVPVIMVTSISDKKDKIAAFKDGADDYITKPFDMDELIERVRTVMRRLKPKPPKKIQNILITGGAGFIGSHLAKALLEKEYDVTIIDDFSTGRKENLKFVKEYKNLQIITGSITDETLVSKAVEKADLIYHLAATVGVKNVVDNPLDTIIYDTFGTQMVLKYASSRGTKVLLTSTSEVYGKSNVYPFQEEKDVVLGPPSVDRWSYACSKLLDEFLAIGYHRARGLPIVVVRLFNIVGPGQLGRYGMVIPRFFKNAMMNETIHIYGDGKQKRCFTYVDDAVKLIISLAENEKANGEVINLGSTNEISVYDLACRIKEMTKSASDIVFEPYEKYYGTSFEDVKKRYPDLTKLKRIAGFTPKTDMESILKNIYAFLKSHPDELKNI